MALNYTLTAATAVLTVSDNFDDTETCTVGGKAYTFQATLTDSDGNVNIGATAALELTNFRAAINLDNSGESAVGAGNDYAASMTINAEVECTAVTATTLTVTAKTPGSVGNLIACTETGGEHAWDNAVLSGGVGEIDGWATSLLALNQINGEVVFELLRLTAGAD